MHYTAGPLSSEHAHAIRAQKLGAITLGVGALGGAVSAGLHNYPGVCLGGVAAVLGAGLFSMSVSAYTKSRGLVKAAAANKRVHDGAPRGP